ncbi:Paired amphipathic helix [Macleaya cordata]|uniref:Paired amphipathic helix n=1 Tax=Macleaya cordata TaxID=56857 RepID=A0A200QV26_MACCD|nr:Paired amphipathic helix [Macleaya cordata]
MTESEDNPNPNDNPAFTYIKLVYDTMRKDPEDVKKFSLFVQELKHFKENVGISGAYERIGIYERMKNLIEGHPDLILGLKEFLAQIQQIHLNPEDHHHQANTSFPSSSSSIIQEDVGGEEYIFFQKVKARFPNNGQVYKKFLDLLKDFSLSKISRSQFYLEIFSLFHHNGADDLFDEVPTNSLLKLQKRKL